MPMLKPSHLIVTLKERNEVWSVLDLFEFIHGYGRVHNRESSDAR